MVEMKMSTVPRKTHGFVMGLAGLMFMIVLAACSSQSSAPTPTSSPAPTGITKGTLNPDSQPSDVAAQSSPTNAPSIPGAALLIDIVDSQGQPVEDGTIEVSIKHEGELSYYNYSYSNNTSDII